MVQPSLSENGRAQVDDIVKNIEGQMKQLSALHRKRLLVSFDDSAEIGKERCVLRVCVLGPSRQGRPIRILHLTTVRFPNRCREIEAQTGAITDLFREAEKLLAGVAKQQGDESDSVLKVRVGGCLCTIIT